MSGCFSVIVRAFCWLAVVIAMLSGEFANPMAASDVAAEVALDYRAQGEYEGRVRDWMGYTGRMGLQVIARGEQKFVAVLYKGGLPANGWDQKTQWSFEGGPDGESIRLGNSLSQSTLEYADSSRGFWYLKDLRGRLVAGFAGVERVSPTMGAVPPSDAVVLFDGETIQGLVSAKKNDNSTLGVGFTTEMPVQDFDLHVEFRTPFEPNKLGQGRGNSGVYIQRRYEVQVLDSFGLEGVENECGALYRQRRPDLNMCFPPLTWQTYDIKFRAARFNEEGEKIQNAKITVELNGRRIHDNVDIKAKTGAGKQESPEPMPILFQDHSNPVQYRNLWIVPR